MNQLNDKSFLQGMSDLMNALDDPEQFVSRLSANIATGFVPNFIRQPLKNTDEFVRDTSPRAEDGYLTNLAKRLGYSVIPQFAPIKQDVWGNPIERVQGEKLSGPGTDLLFRMIDPSNAAFAKQVDPLDLYIFHWNEAQPDRKNRLNIEPIKDYVTASGKKIPLTLEEQQTANRNAGQNAYKYLSSQKWDWKNPTETGVERIKSTLKHFQDQERKKLKSGKIGAGDVDQ